MILVSESAVAAVKDAMEKAGQRDGGLRIHVKQGGCAGYQYVVDLDREQRSDDIIVEADGVRILIDPDSTPWLQGMTLGYKRGLEGEGFTFENPNASSTCGCQKSFN
jgi:iron-sulfur cluster assembly protein